MPACVKTLAYIIIMSCSQI